MGGSSYIYISRYGLGGLVVWKKKQLKKQKLQKQVLADRHTLWPIIVVNLAPHSPTPTKCIDQHFGVLKQVSRNITFNVQQKLTHLPSLFGMWWYIWWCIMIGKVQLILYTSKFNLKILLGQRENMFNFTI